MKKEFEIDNEIINNLNTLVHPHDKIDFLNDYIKKNNEIPLHTLAFIYEYLGDYNRLTHQYKPTLYKKAGSTWEIVSTLKEYNSNNKLKKIALINAYRNYKKAHLIHKKTKSLSHSKLTKEDMKSVKQELHKYGGPLKKISLIIIFTMFLMSIFFIVSTPTGLVTSPLETQEATLTGIILGVLSIIAMFFVIWKWK